MFNWKYSVFPSVDPFNAYRKSILYYSIYLLVTGFNKDNIENRLSNLANSPVPTLFSIMSWLLVPFIAGFLCARVAKHKIYRYAIIVGIITSSVGVLIGGTATPEYALSKSLLIAGRMKMPDDAYWENEVQKWESKLKELEERKARGDLLELDEVREIFTILNSWLRKFAQAVLPELSRHQDECIREVIFDREWRRRWPELDRKLGGRLNLTLPFNEENMRCCLNKFLRHGVSENDRN